MGEHQYDHNTILLHVKHSQLGQEPDVTVGPVSRLYV